MVSSARRFGRRVVTTVAVVAVVLVAAIVVRDRRAHAPDPTPTASATVAPGSTTPAAPTVPTGSPAPLDNGEANGVVDWIIDGDTIDVTFGDRTERIRLIGINTPEIAHESSDDRPGNAAECFGPEATEFTRSLIPPGTPVRVERDVVARDDYGRLLGYVYRADDDVFVNYELIHQGFARPLSIAPNTTYQSTFADAASEAEQADLGLWMACK